MSRETFGREACFVAQRLPEIGNADSEIIKRALLSHDGAWAVYESIGKREFVGEGSTIPDIQIS